MDICNIEQGIKILFSYRVHGVLIHKSVMLWRNDLHFKEKTTNIRNFTLRGRFISLQFGHFVSIFYVESLYATKRNMKLIYPCQNIIGAINLTNILIFQFDIDKVHISRDIYFVEYVPRAILNIKYVFTVFPLQE